MIKPAFIAFSILACSTFIAASARAEDPSMQDKEFIAIAASANTLEIRLGEYASMNASNDDVKKFAEHMVGDHAKTADDLKTLATRQPIEIPKALNADDKGVLEKLEKLKGAELDKAYVAQMVEDHKKAVAVFEKETKEGSDIGIKGFAEKTLPTLKHHLKMAEHLNTQVNS